MPPTLGEPLSSYVMSQIKTRQIAHGSGISENRTPDQLSYLNSKTAWVKLASAVRVGSLYPSGPFKGKWSKLAKQYVLFNGVSSLEGGKLNPRGNSDGNNIWNPINGTYNINPTNSNSGEFGLVPMFGITGIDVKSENRGSITKATVNIKCYSPEQFEILEVLYLRIGYTMLLEWGWSLYLDNSGNLKQVGQTLVEDPDGVFNDKWKNVSNLKFVEKIKSKRQQYNGNYDGMLGKITNFSWKFNQDGSYDVTLNLSSLGDVVESLKCNITPTSQISKYISDSYKLFGDEQDTATNTTGSADSAQNQQSKTPPSPTNNIISAYFFVQKIYLTTVEKNANYYKDAKDFASKYKEGLIPVRSKFIEPDSKNVFGTKQGPKDFAYLNYNSPANDEDLINDEGLYVRFGHFLDFLNSKVIFKVKGTKTSILPVDSDENNNKMYIFPYQVSLDPRVCIVRNDEKILSKEFYVGEKGNGLKTWKKTGSNNAYGQTMNIYLNCQMINNILNEKQDNKGDIALFDVLSDICKNLNEALGGVNNLEPIIDAEDNIIKIIDSSYVPSVKEDLIELYGYNPSNNQSNFVTNISIKTEITNDSATLVNVGATSAGYVKGTENTMFAKWNKGLIDRFKEEIIEGAKPSKSTPLDKDVAKTYVQEFWNKVYSPFGLTSPQDVPSNDSTIEDACALDNTIIDKNKSTVTEFFKYCNAKIQNIKDTYSSPSSGFVPIGLSLTFEGISGIKIYNSLNVSTRFLPESYPESLKFIVKGVSHTISDNSWETKIDTMTVNRSSDDIKYKNVKAYVNRFIKETKAELAEKKLPPQLPTVFQPIVTGGTGVNVNNTLPNVTIAGAGSKLEEYTKQAAVSLFGATGQSGKSAACGGFTYRAANFIAQKLRNTSIPQKGGNDADSPTIRKNLDSLGIYTSDSVTPVATGIDLKSAKAKIAEIESKANYGDVVLYFATPVRQKQPAGSGNYRFHAQFYTGDFYTAGGQGGGKYKNKWSSSWAGNYSLSFVYGDWGPWEIYWFRVKDEYKK